MRTARAQPSAISDEERREYEDLVYPIPELNSGVSRHLRMVLREYYQGRSSSWPRVGLDVWSVMRRNRLQPTDVPHGHKARGEWVAGLAEAEKARRFEAYRKEMDDFARFLRLKYLGPN